MTTYSYNADRIRRELAVRAMTIEDLAAKSGLGRSTLWYWLSGGKRPRPATAKAVADALGIPLEELVIEVNGADRAAS